MSDTDRPNQNESVSARDDYENVRDQPTVVNEPGATPAPDSCDALRTQIPQQFGRYRIIKKLGEGGMGSVYLAHDTNLERQVALKVPHFRPEEGKAILERFFKEARSAATLHHPNLCPVHDVGKIGGVHFLTMTFIDGKPLTQFMEPEKPLPPRQVAALIRKLALAIDEAHQGGVVHRDLKPANIMIDKRHEPVIMDFGLALRKQTGNEPTQVGAMIGTPEYMSPEQVRGNENNIGPGTDIYSLGVILYQLLTGQLPFEGTPRQVLAAILTSEPKRPSEIRPSLDLEIEAICLKGLAKRASDRHATARELAAGLKKYLRNRSPVQIKDPNQSPTGQLAAELFSDLSENLETASSTNPGIDLSAVPHRKKRPPWLWLVPIVPAAVLVGFVILWALTNGITSNLVDAIGSQDVTDISRVPQTGDQVDSAEVANLSFAEPSVDEKEPEKTSVESTTLDHSYAPSEQTPPKPEAAIDSETESGQGQTDPNHSADTVAVLELSRSDEIVNNDSQAKVVRNPLLPPKLGNPRNSDGDFIELDDGRILFAYVHHTGKLPSHRPAPGAGPPGPHGPSRPPPPPRRGVRPPRLRHPGRPPRATRQSLYQSADSSFVAGRYSSDGGITWTGNDSVLLDDEADKTVRCLSLLRLQSGRIALFYLRENSSNDCCVHMRVSTDETESWSKPVVCTPKRAWYRVHNDRVIQLTTGRLVIPVERSTTSTGSHVTLCLLSDDEGKTWRGRRTQSEATAELSDPGIVELSDGALFMWFRSDQSRLYQSHSTDGGNTWSAPEATNVVCPNLPASCERIPRSRDLLMVWNDYSGIVAPDLDKGTPYNAAISRDDGMTWGNVRTLEDKPTGFYSYTSIDFVGNRVLLGHLSGDDKVGHKTRTQITSFKVDWLYE